MIRFILYCGVSYLGSNLWGDIPTPQLLCPANGMKMTDVATYFRWVPVQDCQDYDIQIARDAYFNAIYKEKQTRNVTYHEDSYFPKNALPAGNYWWRVRGIVQGQKGPWSKSFSLNVNDDHSLAGEVIRPLGPDRPIFLMRVRDTDVPKFGDNLKKLFPIGSAQVVVPDDINIWEGSDKALTTARKYEDMGVDFVVWNNRARMPLSLLEYLFQNFKHCIGTAEGEHFWSYGWEKGPEGNISEWDYVDRAFIICGKYGRRYFIADGENGNYKWTVLGVDYKDQFIRYHRNIVPMYKTNISNVALHSLGAVEGLMASGYVDNCGFWDDQFIWPAAHFGKLGEIDTHWSEATDLCPPAFDVQCWLMGVASGATAFQLESAHQWTDQGHAAENYTKFYLPFVQAVVNHHLLPSRKAFLSSIKIAVDCDYNRAKSPHHDVFEPDFSFLTRLYSLKHRPSQEIIPDNSRYGLICLLPPGASCLNMQTQVISQEDLSQTAAAVGIFNKAYPARFQGEAFMWECDGTVVITNSNENQDINQAFHLPFDAAFPIQAITGDIGVHQYLIGKSENNGRNFWFQVNGQDPGRPLKLKFTCHSNPAVVSKPESAVTYNWNESTHELEMTISYAESSAEVELRNP
jgi:hypothetical protein